MIDTDTIGLCQIMPETLFNETVGQGECHISWVDISFDYSSIIFCLNVTYRCIYGFNQSPPKYLFHGDVFKESK
jgi:hypothetical protein